MDWNAIAEVSEFGSYTIDQICGFFGLCKTELDIMLVELDIVRKYGQDIDSYAELCKYINQHEKGLLNDGEVRFATESILEKIPSIHMKLHKAGNPDFVDLNSKSPIRAYLRPFDLIYQDAVHVCYIAFRVERYSVDHFRKMAENVDIPGMREYLKSETFLDDFKYLENVPDELIIKYIDLIDKRKFLRHINEEKLLYHTITLPVHNKTLKLCLKDALELQSMLDCKELIQKEVDSVLYSFTQCGVCNESFVKWRRACGSCPNYMCIQCAEKWYTISPGERVEKSKLSCPFCRSKPVKDSVVIAGNLLDYDEKMLDIEFKNDRIYGLCEGCGKVADAGPKEGCAAELKFSHFICVPCKTGDGQKKCPKCGVITQLAAACNHITCICGEHWCYRCGKGGFDRNSVYTHMDREHGGYYN